MIVKEFQSLDLNEISLDISKTVFLCGSGISINSGLPNGEKLTEYYIEKVLGNYCADIIIKKWKRLKRKFKRISGVEMPFIRLEFIIGCVDEIDRELNNKPILSGIKKFMDLKINENHALLFHLIKDNSAIIITPNFDCGIEKVELPLSAPSNHLGVPTHKIGQQYVYHYHGIANDINSLGATIGRIKKGLPVEFANYLKSLFTNEHDCHNLICIGFSCSDYFDIIPFFESLPSESFKGQAIFFQHGNNVEEGTKRKVESMFQGFIDKKILLGDTTDFLRQLSGRNDLKIEVQFTEDWWKEDFDAIKIIPKHRKYYLIKLSNQLGLKITRRMLKKGYFDSCKSPKKIIASAYKEIIQTDIAAYLAHHFREDLNKSYITDIFSFYRYYWDNKKTREKIKQYIDKYKELAKRDLVQEFALNMSFDEIVTAIQKCSINESGISSIYINALTHHSRAYLHNYRHCKRCPIYRERLEILLRCTGKLLMLHFTKFKYVSYNLSLTRYQWRIKQALYAWMPNKDDEKEQLYIALEICALNHAIKMYACKAELNRFAFYRNGSPIALLNFLKWAFIYWRMQREIYVQYWNRSLVSKNITQNRSIVAIERMNM